MTERVTRSVERGQPLDELRKAITPGDLRSLAADGVRRRVECELGTTFLGENPVLMFEGSVASNVEEVFAYLTERKGKQELPSR